jgi:outer membrane receptor for Fe3+-dicitrate
MFADPAAIYAQFRPCVLGVDNNCGGSGNIRGFNRWNMDATIAKDFRWGERLRVTASLQFTNVFNHFQPSDPSLNLNSPQTFGVVSGQIYSPRQTEFGLRIAF